MNISKKGVKAQIAMEFIMIVGVAFIVMMLFLIASSNEISQESDSRSQSMLRDVMFRTQTEINLATEALSGYERRFTNPELLYGLDYSLQNNNTELTGNLSNYEFVLIIPKVLGSAKPGYNLIKNIEGVVCLNEVCSTYDFDKPYIDRIQPENGSTSISVYSPITIWFNEDMNESSLSSAFSMSGISVNLSYDNTFYTATFTPITPLQYNTKYTVTFTNTANDLAGNNLLTGLNWSFETETDLSAPDPITNLDETETGSNYIVWNWTNPADFDFSHVKVKLNGTFVTNTSNEYYTANGLSPDSYYEISVKAYDTSENSANEVSDIARTNTTTNLTVDLWELAVDLPEPVDFSSGLNSTANSFDLGNGNDGWDTARHSYDAGSTYYDNPADTDIVKFDSSGGVLEITVGGYGTPMPKGPAYNDPVSGAYGIEFTITPTMANIINNGGNATLEFDWISDDPTGLEHDFEAVWIKARISNSSGKYYFGSSLDGDSTPADDNDLDAITDSTNELYYALKPNGVDANNHEIINLNEYISTSGNYYLDFGAKISDWSHPTEVYIGTFDNIILRITG